jgi:hypothetical protein
MQSSKLRKKLGRPKSLSAKKLAGKNRHDLPH